MDIRHTAKFAMHNKAQLIVAENCGCFHCLSVFDPKEIKEWTDNNDTAICPYCSVDAVLAESNDIRIDKEMLAKLNAYWF
jgi:hypothetical protein